MTYFVTFCIKCYVLEKLGDFKVLGLYNIYFGIDMNIFSLIKIRLLEVIANRIVLAFRVL